MPESAARIQGPNAGPSAQFIDVRSGSISVDQRTVYQQVSNFLGFQTVDASHAHIVSVLRRLAGAVWEHEAIELARLVGDTADVRSADIGFVQPPLIWWRTDGGVERGRVAQIRDYYASLDRGRLVVLGAAGSGKTVLATQLARDLAEEYATSLDRGGPPRGSGRRRSGLPVRMSAPLFDPGPLGRFGEVSPVQVAWRFDRWLSGNLSRTYGLKKEDAADLVSGGWIVPILDGVDEMDMPGEPPWRAAALLMALNRPTRTGVRPAVLTFRTDRYSELVLLDHDALGRPVLQDATVVTMEPLAIDSVRRYLIHRFPDPICPGGAEYRWRPILDQMESDQEAAQEVTPVAAALRSPLSLFLAVNGYRNPETSPDVLNEFKRIEDLNSHLFQLLVPSAVADYGKGGGDRFSSDQVTRWLTTLARHLSQEDLDGRSGSDLLLHLLSRVAGLRSPRFAAGIVLAGFAALAVTLMLIGASGSGGWQIGDLLGLVALIGAVLFVGWRGSRPYVDLQRFDVREIRRLLTWHLFRVWIGTVLSVGLLLGVVLAAAIFVHRFGVIGGFVAGILHGMAASFMFGLVLILEVRPQGVSRPSRLVSQGISHTVLTFSTVFMATSGGTAVLFVLGVVPVAGTPILMIIGIGMLAGVAVVTLSPWPRYVAACVLLSWRGRMPLRPSAFLDWAYEAGLLRLSGIAVQFRHRDFQDWLVKGSSS